MDTTSRIAVIGAGLMGGVIATLYARHGYSVVLHDTNHSALDGFHARLKPVAEALADDDVSVEQIFSNIQMEAELQRATENCALVHETVQEDLTVKQDLFAKLDKICTPEVILATNTSSFLLSDLAPALRDRGRLIGIHFVGPAHIIPIVEIIKADFTSQTVLDWTRSFVKSFGYTGVVCHERPGFLINRIQLAILGEVYRMLREGVASAEDIDSAVRLSLGPRLALWGPLLTEDLAVSKKTSLAVFDYVHEKTGDARFAVDPVLREKVDRGELGAITGQGWYHFKTDYSSVVKLRDTQLGQLLKWLRANDHVAELVGK